MNYNDHNPPHFHAKYQDYEILIYIHTGEIIGNISRQGLKLIYLWLDENKEALLENWELAKLHKNLKTIKPLL